MTSNYANMLFAVVEQRPVQAVLSLRGKGHGFIAGGRPSAICVENFDHRLFWFPVNLLYSVDWNKTCICHVHAHSCSSQCFVLKVMSQWEWESIHSACYQWAVLLSAGTVWLQEHFKEPVRRRSKPVRWDMRSQRAALQQLNDVEASSSVRQ